MEEGRRRVMEKKDRVMKRVIGTDEERRRKKAKRKRKEESHEEMDLREWWIKEGAGEGLENERG